MCFRNTVIDHTDTSNFRTAEDFRDAQPAPKREVDVIEQRTKLKPRMRVVRDMLLNGSYTAKAVAVEINSRLGTNTDTAAATARIRDLRKPQYGAYDVRTHRVDGRFFYTIVN